ncbi:helix-turn-helix domain-containing protein [Nocardioides sp. NPDC006303]|uniref:winged helix-turn-helix transcriptional regulator n=1 Tax=Nocardioides sp. NPDC006303 TaxID=3156747 RepID=UPI0033B8CCB0
MTSIGSDERNLVEIHPLTGAVPPVEYCPVSIGANLIGDRWTLLVVRELMVGSSGFNDIHRGLPGLNRSVLSDRLRHLEHLGLLERLPIDSPSRRHEYALTDAGRALYPVIKAIGAWTVDWRFPRPTDRQSDPALLLWRMHQGMDRNAIPGGGICIEFRFPDTDPSRGWIRADSKGSGACLGSPDYDVDLIVTATPRVLNEVWYGHRALPAALGAGLVEIEGPQFLVGEFPRWFGRSPFADLVQEKSSGQRMGER